MTQWPKETLPSANTSLQHQGVVFVYTVSPGSKPASFKWPIKLITAWEKGRTATEHLEPMARASGAVPPRVCAQRAGCLRSVLPVTEAIIPGSQRMEMQRGRRRAAPGEGPGRRSPGSLAARAGPGPTPPQQPGAGWRTPSLLPSPCGCTTASVSAGANASPGLRPLTTTQPAGGGLPQQSRPAAPSLPLALSGGLSPFLSLPNALKPRTPKARL